MEVLLKKMLALIVALCALAGCARAENALSSWTTVPLRQSAGRTAGSPMICTGMTERIRIPSWLTI